MTPLEVNIAIAEFKMLKIMLSPKDQNGLYIEAKIGGTIPYLKTTNWAENISDAWELFEEMPTPEIGLMGGKYICSSHGFRGLCINKADTAPMAIALAWLAWKKNK